MCYKTWALGFAEGVCLLLKWFTGSISEVYYLMHKFTSTESVYNKKHNRQGLVYKEAIEVTVLGQLSLEDQHPQSLINDEQSYRCFTFHCFLHKHKLNQHDGFDCRLQFCKLLTRRLIDNPYLLYNICVSIKWWFFLYGLVGILANINLSF